MCLPKGLSAVIYFACLGVKSQPVPADSFPEGFSHAAAISNPAMLVLNSDFFFLSFVRNILLVQKPLKEAF